MHGWFEEGVNDPTIVHRASQIGLKLSERAVRRHRANHLVPVDQMEDIDPTMVTDPETGGVNDIALLDLIIMKGQETLKLRTAKVSPEMALKAMDLKYKLTQGNAFQDFIDAFAGVNEAMAAEEELPESPDVVSGGDEQAQAEVE